MLVFVKPLSALYEFLLLGCFLIGIPFASAQKFTEIAKIVASDRDTNDQFGLTAAISGNYAIVGAHLEDHDASGGNILDQSGAAYIYEKNNLGNWVQVQKIVAADRAAGDWFGCSVSISGNYAIIGARQDDRDVAGANFMEDAGSAYIFERNSLGIWVQTQKIVASDRNIRDSYGSTVGISGDYAIVCARWEDEDATGTNYLKDAGSAYIFERNAGGNWVQVQKVVTNDRAVNDRLGESVSISGNYAIIGDIYEDEDVNGLNTINNAGSAYIFERNAGGNWVQAQKIVASDRGTYLDLFGISVSISGNYAVVGAFLEDEDASGVNTINGAGAAYIFERNGSGSWIEVQKIVASDRDVGDYFGVAVSIHANNIIVGASHEDDDSLGANLLADAGSAYIYQRNGSGNWLQVQKIVASDRDSIDYFGEAVGISGNNIIVGAYWEDEDLVNANPLENAGSAYIFNNCTQATSSTIDTTTCNSYTSPSGKYTWFSSNTYTDTISNASGCDSIITVNLSINNSTSNSISETVCDSYTSPSGKLWTTSNTYLDTIPNNGGCDSVITINLTVNTTDASLTTNNTTITATNGFATSYQWINCITGDTIAGEVNPNFTATVSGSYAVLVKDGACNKLSDCINIDIPVVCESVFLPTAFSPNNDGINEKLCLFGNCIKTMQLSIYDRWGEKVFETSDKNECWDGIYKGMIMNTGIFTYRLKAMLITGESFSDEGTIALIR